MSECNHCGSDIEFVGKLASERDALKAEVERLKTDYKGMLELASAKIKGPVNSMEQISKLQIDRDRWKALAGELAEALRRAQNTIHGEFCGSKPHHNCCQAVLDDLASYNSVSKEAQ